MMISNKIAVQEIVRLAKALNISDVVLSPGSRNAPFTLSFSNDNFFNIHQIIDERSAGFVALGMAIKSKKPIILSCTSGSAALNYAPAVLEAYNQGVPLIIITSDRPSYGYKIGDGQCFNQQFCYANYINHQVHLNEDENSSKEETIKGVKEAFQAVLSANGPVHLNVAFEEPLYDLVEVDNKQIQINIERSSVVPFDFMPWVNQWGNYSSKLIIVSQGAPKQIKDLLTALQRKDSSVYVVQENLSNIADELLNSCIDRTLKPLGEKIKDWTPELVVTIGSNIVSKAIKQVFRQNKPKAHWSFHNHLKQDIFQLEATHFEGQVEEFFKEILDSEKSVSSDYRDRWISFNNEIELLHDVALGNTSFSDLKAFEIILKGLPSCDLHLGNSSVVRYAQLFNPRTDISYYGNRGISGIEGCTSTAVGFAIKNSNLTVLITGDMSFFYDSNAFWNKENINLLIIIINNGGGSIFKIIDGPSEHERSLNYFVGEYTPDVQQFCSLHKLVYASANDEKQLTNYLTTFRNEGKGIQVLEVDTSKIENEKILKNYFGALKSKDLIAHLSKVTN